MTTLVKLLLINNQVKRKTFFELYNWKYYNDVWNLDFTTPTGGIMLVCERERLSTYTCLPYGTYEASIRKGSKLYKWVLKQRAFVYSGSTFYIVPPPSW